MRKNTRHLAYMSGAALVAVVGGSIWSSTRYTPLEASSHREAPLIANDPLADNTDVYAFRSPADANKVVLIANYIPFQLPQGGPNYYTFGENVHYEIHVKNDGTTAGDDITYRFTFTRTNQDPSTFFNVRLAQQNLKTTYICEKSVNGGAFTPIVTAGEVPANNIGPRSINSGVGLSQPSYTNYWQSKVATASGLGGEQVFCGPADDPFFVDLGGVFDLGNIRPNSGARDGVAKYNVHSICITAPIATLSKTHTNSPANILDGNYVIGVWASASRPGMRTLSTTGANPADTNPYVQVSRLGMPLTNEVINPIGAKDAWNARTPYTEAAVTDDYLSNPELALYVTNGAFGAAVPGFAPLYIQTMSLGAYDFRNGASGLSGLAGNAALNGTALAPFASGGFGEYLLVGGKPRSVDIKPIFHTGVPNLRPYQLATGKPVGNPLAAGKPFVNNFLPLTPPGFNPATSNPGGDMLRLNMAVPVTPRNSADFSNDGLLAAAVLGLTDARFNGDASLQSIPNMDGFPNGRRLEDAVDKIELKAVGGAVLAAIGLYYDDYVTNQSPLTPQFASVLGFTSGVERNDTTLRIGFPFVQTPWNGYKVRRF